MLRAILDTNVYVAGLLAPQGSCARILVAIGEARFDAIVCPALLTELRVVLARDKFTSHVSSYESARFIEWLDKCALHAADPGSCAIRSPDPSDDYLIALAAETRADALVTGDQHLLGVAAPAPRILSVAEFAAMLELLP